MKHCVQIVDLGEGSYGLTSCTGLLAVQLLPTLSPGMQLAKVSKQDFEFLFRSRLEVIGSNGCFRGGRLHKVGLIPF